MTRKKHRATMERFRRRLSLIINNLKSDFSCMKSVLSPVIQGYPVRDPLLQNLGESIFFLAHLTSKTL
jgi:hypothetical protein